MIEKVSCFTVVQNDKDFLLVTEPKQGRDLVGLVGGTMEPGDRHSPEACALREGAEEAGQEIALTGLLLYKRSPIPGTHNLEHERIIFSGTPAESFDAAELLPEADFYSYKAIRRLHEQDLLRSNGTWRAIRTAHRREPMPMTAWVDLRARASSRNNQNRRKNTFVVAA